MKVRFWWKITLIILTISALLGLSGCQVIEGMENTADEFSQIQDRLEQAVFNLLAGINIGGALPIRSEHRRKYDRR
jgi:hypothetical protein